MLRAHLIFLVVIALFCARCASSEMVSYHINDANVASADIITYGDKYFISIILSQSSANEFKTVTEKNRGKILQIFCGDVVLTEPVVKEVINSGRIRSHAFDSVDDAREVLKCLKGDRILH